MEPLYKIANEYASLMNEDLDPEFLADTIEGMEGEFDAKVEQLLALIKNQKYYADALKEEASKLAERAKHAENKIDSIKQYIVSCMETSGRKSLTAGLQSLTVRAGSVSVEVENPDIIPAQYVTYETTAKVDKMAIKAQLKAGAVIEGVSLKTGKPSLIIK